jgi:hypothetical protein
MGTDKTTVKRLVAWFGSVTYNIRGDLTFSASLYESFSSNAMTVRGTGNIITYGDSGYSRPG